jgi:hypothetical protein
MKPVSCTYNVRITERSSKIYCSFDAVGSLPVEHVFPVFMVHTPETSAAMISSISSKKKLRTRKLIRSLKNNTTGYLVLSLAAKPCYRSGCRSPCNNLRNKVEVCTSQCTSHINVDGKVTTVDITAAVHVSIEHVVISNIDNLQYS